MDFDGLVSSYGSGLRPVGCEDDLRDFKVAKIDDENGFSVSKAMQQRSPLLRSNTSLLSDGQQMLSFSSPNTQAVTFPYYYHHTSPSYGRNTGYGSGGGLNNTAAAAANMHGVLTGVRGPFTPSQWMELEHQALIYKYITANAPIPSNLLIPIRKALESAGLSAFSGGYLRHNALGWGGYPLGFSNSTDPEPGRCRRTDGKKWRCSRDAVPEQKYCERHMNRGRHRSRKPVEGQSGHSVSGPTNAKNMPATRVAAGGGISSGIGVSHQQQLSNLQQPTGAANPSASPHLNRGFLNKANASEKIQESTAGLSMENNFSLPKHQNLYEEESSRMEFGLVCSDSLLNPLHKTSPLINCRNEINDSETKSQQHSLRQFMDDFPKNQSKHTPIFWTDTQSERTQLSISIPNDFMSSGSSPTNEKLALSPLRLSRELESTQMGLGMGVGPTGLDEPSQREAQWVPISWGNSMGGPLGEVLHSTNNSLGECSNTSALNLMTEGWDRSPPVGSSPTGVLQKTTFRSLSNSSAGSSPRTEHNKGHEGVSICNNLLGSALINSTMPAL
ncbi:hypothetical protein LguiB_017400 [Lonicera macranthoides]